MTDATYGCRLFSATTHRPVASRLTVKVTRSAVLALHSSNCPRSSLRSMAPCACSSFHSRISAFSSLGTW